MTKVEAVKDFNNHVKPSIIKRYGKNDKPAMRQAWNDYIDSLQRDGRISMKQANTWDSPIKR